MKIRDIFAAQGEAEFRRLEQKAADWLEYHVSGTVVSTGGGFHFIFSLLYAERHGIPSEAIPRFPVCTL
ncbi:MAG: hypothetical protein D3914_08680 [Candidatus Electrothrix sp. LOE2]|nr:hypothetical protein [Candidatus Electrothrix sp. LOE2]